MRTETIGEAQLPEGESEGEKRGGLNREQESSLLEFAKRMSGIAVRTIDALVIEGKLVLDPRDDEHDMFSVGTGKNPEVLVILEKIGQDFSWDYEALSVVCELVHEKALERNLAQLATSIVDKYYDVPNFFNPLPENTDRLLLGIEEKNLDHIVSALRSLGEPKEKVDCLAGIAAKEEKLALFFSILDKYLEETRRRRRDSDAHYG